MWAVSSHHQRAKETRQQGRHGLFSLPSRWIVPGLSSRALVRPAAPLKPLRLRTRRFGRIKTCRSRNNHGNPEDSQKRNPGRLIFSPPLLSRDAVRHWTCVRHPPMQQQPEGDAAQAAFDRGISYNKREIPDLQAHGIVCRLLVWTADGRPHPAVTRTLQIAANIAACRNGQQMSAKVLQHRLKHEVQNSPPPTKSRKDTGSPSSRSHQSLDPRTPTRWRRRR